MGLFGRKKNNTQLINDIKKAVTPLRPKKYDMETVAGINSIPVPAGGDTYYVLQRKATEHKRNGKMDEAIACLRKSNALSDHEYKPLLMEKDYMRLVKYLEAAGRKDEAAVAKNEIYKKHPEFMDKRISNRKRIIETINRCEDLNEDLVYITTNNKCPICSKYNRKTYSISGKTKGVPILPTKFIVEGGFCKDCIVGISIKPIY